MNWIRKLLKRKPRFRDFGSDGTAVEAFRHKGKVYYHFTDNFKIPAARGLCALAIYEELRMRCDREYLEQHIQYTDYLLNGGQNGKVDLTKLALINSNLKERINLAPFPDHIYRLASVTFFDETESPYSYDFAYNQKKIEEWKQDGEILDFFLKGPFIGLMPSFNTSGLDANTYFAVASQIAMIHQKAYPAEQFSTS